MAANVTSTTCLSTVFSENLLLFIQNCLDEKNIVYRKLSVSKRTRDLREGDYSIAKGCTSEIPQEEMQLLCQKIKQESATWPLQLKSIVPSKYYCFTFYLDRPSTFKTVLTDYWEKDLSVKKDTKEHILLNPADFHIDEISIKNKTSVDLLRSAVLLQHVSLLLKDAGYTVSFVKCSSTPAFCDVFDLVGLPSDALMQNTDCHICTETSKLMETLQVNDYFCSDCGVDKNQKKESSDSKQSAESAKHSKTSLNLRRYIEDQGILVGDMAYDKNLTDAEVISDDGVSASILSQIHSLHDVAGKLKEKSLVIHMAATSRSFYQQKVDISWKIIWPEDRIPQSHFNYGKVQARQQKPNSELKTLEEFVQLRQRQMTEAAVIKYGEEVKGTGWAQTILTLTVASIKFELLQPVHNSTVKVDMSDGSDFGSDNRSGAFVMYNCARLSTLFSHFDQAVRKGTYPSLPSLDEIDFSLLREEDEWYLLFQFILPYKSLFAEVVESIYPSERQIHAKIHTHKICNFLTSLSRSLSSYYSRTHILAENRVHLLPVMYTRLYLLKVIHKIMVHALSLMGISPVNQL